MSRNTVIEERQVWVVRAGKGGRYFEEFRTHDVVTLGFIQGDVAEAIGMSREQLVELGRRRMPHWSKYQAANQAGQLYRFLCDMQVGDDVATYDPERRLYWVGKVKSEPRFDESITDGQPFVRDVEWQAKVARDSLSVEARNSLGAIMSLFRLTDPAASELRGRSVDKSAPDTQVEAAPKPIEQEEDRALEELRAETREKAAGFIEDEIAKLDDHQMEHLVAGILRAMGYRTRVSPRGPDRGVDVMASPDGLMLEEPRIFVEVKHRRSTAMGSQEIRAFLGGRKAGDRCLYVSTGGFTKDARYEAERSDIPLTLLTLSDIGELVAEHYDNMDVEARSLVRLVRVYWPVGDEG